MSGNTSATGGYIPAVPPPPVGADEITAELQVAVKTMTGLPGNLVRPRWQALPPTQPPVDTTWVAFGIKEMLDSLDYPYIKHDGVMQIAGAPGPGADILERIVKVVMTLTFYGPQCSVYAGLLRDGFYIQQNWEQLNKLGLRLYEVKDLTWSPELINQQWVDRFDMQIIMSQSLTRTYPVLNLDGADVVTHAPQVPDQTTIVREDTVPRP